MSFTSDAQDAAPDGPWTKYAPATKPAAAPTAPADGPWTKYAPPGDDLVKAYGSGISQGVGGLVEAPGGSASDLGSAVAGWTKKHIFDPSQYTGPAAQAARGYFDAAGNWIAEQAKGAVKDTWLDPNYQPTTATGRIAQTAGQMTPYAIAGPMAPEAIAARAGTQVALPALTTEGGRQLGAAYLKDPELGAAVGGLAGAGIGGFGRTFIPSAEREAASTVLGTPQLPPFAGGSPAGATIAKGLSKVPLVKIPLQSAAKSAAGQTEAAAGKIAGAAGATTPDATGAAIENEFNNANQGISDAAKTAYDKVTQGLPAGSDTVTSPLSNTQAAADAISARRTASAAGAGPAYNEVEDALTRPGGLTYQGMRDLRTRLRQEGNRSGLTPGEQAEYGSLQDALTKDINSHLDTLDPTQASSTALKQADQTYASDQGRIQAVGRRLGIDNAGVGNEEYVNRIEGLALGGKQNADLLGQVRQTLGPSVADQTAAQIAKKWWTGADGQFAPVQFFKKYDSLTPEAKDALFGKPGQGQFRDSYDALSARAKSDPTLQSVLGAGGGGHGSSFITGMLGAGTESAIAHYASPALAAKLAPLMAVPGAMSIMMSRPGFAATAAKMGRLTTGLEFLRKGGVPDAQQNAAKIMAGTAGEMAAQLPDQGQQ